MYLTAMTHRDELYDLTLRWLNDHFHPDDGNTVSKIFVYESAISAVAVEHMIGFLSRWLDSSLKIERIRQKHVLRERIIAHQPLQNPRMQELTDTYLENPKFFFPHLPIDAVAITDSDSRLAAIARIKRLSRVAEKISYRLVDALFKEVQAEANRLAGQRAAAAGAELIDFISSTTAMHTDFIEAEATVAHRFQDGNVHIDRQALTINDIIGFKIIGSSQMLDHLTQALYDEPGITVIEREKHSGDYNAVNLLLDLDLPSTSVLTGHMQTIDWSIGLRRGLSPEYLRRNVAEYVNQGAISIRIEIILTTYEELMEAEFGRSIHELRVLRLRHRLTYAGPLGQNAGYLIEYLLALASSPTVSIPEIPIKMYGRYLPEAIATLKCALHGIDIDGGLLSTFCPEQDCLRHSPRYSSQFISRAKTVTIGLQNP